MIKKNKTQASVYCSLLSYTLLKLYNFDTTIKENKKSFYKFDTIKHEFRQCLELGFVVEKPDSFIKLYKNFKKGLGIFSTIGFNLSKGEAFDTFRKTLLGYAEKRETFESLEKAWMDLLAYVEANKEKAKAINNKKLTEKRKIKTFDRDSSLFVEEPRKDVPKIYCDDDLDVEGLLGELNL